jgi:hypothetical protein
MLLPTQPDIDTADERVIVYIWGNLTDNNFTPREKDTKGRPGQFPGLSASVSIQPGRKAQGLDTSKLTPPLCALPDDVSQGGTPGHYAIAPLRENGEVDVAGLEAWAKSRDAGEKHDFTQILLNAVVEPNVKGT